MLTGIGLLPGIFLVISGCLIFILGIIKGSAKDVVKGINPRKK